MVDNNSGRCGQPDDSNFGAYTRAGAHLYVLDQPLESESSLIVMEGLTKVFSAIPPAGDWPDGGNPAMALWSPTSEAPYYRQGKDVWKLTVGSAPVRFLTNTVWYYPTFSPDGTHLAYALIRPDGFHDTYIMDIAHGSAPKLIGAGLRNLPVFLNNSQLWFRAEGPGEACGPSGVGPRLYNVVSGVESSTIIESVYNVWPATSSNW